MEKKMSMRLSALFMLVTLLSGGLVMRLLVLSAESGYVAAATSQCVYKVSVYKTRGKIYDCRMRPVAGGRKAFQAVILPSQQTVAHLTGMLDREKMVDLAKQLTGRHPFVCEVSSADVQGQGVDVFCTETRYSEKPIAPHLVGYVNGDGVGAAGIERAYDEYLSAASGELIANYTVDARGNGLEGLPPEINDTTGRSAAGVVLTIDVDIQLAAQQAAEQYIDRGAVVVEDMQGNILAMVSMPEFKQSKVSDYLDREDSPLLNRAMTAYDTGSVFKLAVAAAAIEWGVSPDTKYTCEGEVTVGSNVFHCSNRTGHGEVDMRQATALSCNCYFINLAQRLGGEKLLDYARCFGLGKSVQLADDLYTQSGCLPNTAELSQPAALANFSFGQGKLMTTPVHVAAMTAAIANGGQYFEPTVFSSLVDENGAVIKSNKKVVRQAVTDRTAALLRGFMIAAVTDGTAAKGALDGITSGAKTGTAQTGIIRDGRSVKQAWYTGFFPAEQPEYVCTVLVEDGDSGGGSAAPVFKALCERIAEISAARK